MNGTKIYPRLRRTMAWAVLAAAAAWSCFSLVENRQEAWAQEIQQGPAFYPAAHTAAVENLFAGLR